jgi:hypothetical protein
MCPVLKYVAVYVPALYSKTKIQFLTEWREKMQLYSFNLPLIPVVNSAKYLLHCRTACVYTEALYSLCIAEEPSLQSSVDKGVVDKNTSPSGERILPSYKKFSPALGPKQ